MYAAISGGKRGRGLANAAARCARCLVNSAAAQGQSRYRRPDLHTNYDNDTPSESIRDRHWRRSGAPMTHWAAAH